MRLKRKLNGPLFIGFESNLTHQVMMMRCDRERVREGDLRVHVWRCMHLPLMPFWIGILRIHVCLSVVSQLFFFCALGVGVCFSYSVFFLLFFLLLQTTLARRVTSQHAAIVAHQSADHFPRQEGLAFGTACVSKGQWYQWWQRLGFSGKQKKREIERVTALHVFICLELKHGILLLTRDLSFFASSWNTFLLQAISLAFFVRYYIRSTGASR